ncbi:MAG: hypothetical protein PHV36_08910 [Elusimicrobiales bacterium]|nr:hypothetical protein [Elusimicrobiales bacterium]
MRDGFQRGEMDGRRQGYSDGINEGEWDGRRNGTNEGASAGRQAGRRDGWGVDQAAGTQNGGAAGRNAGTANGTQAGQKRCYDEGYTNAYNAAYAVANELGLQDAASYQSGYKKGQSDAAVIEVANGQKAGYQAGFSQREAELQSSLDTRAMRDAFTKSLPLGVKPDLPIERARGGYATPEESQAYDNGYREGYQRGYRRAYDDAKRQGYNERYQYAYRQAYNVQYSISYRDGYAEGKAQGYQEAYSAAYNSAYGVYYDEYSKMDYADQRAQGLKDGQAAGQKDGFAAGCAEQTKRGYKAGYEKTAAEVYPGAFAAGKQAGIAAADRYYRENAVLKVAGVSLYDENGNGKFEAGENVMMRAEIKNFGFQPSDTVSIAAGSERGDIAIASNLSAAGVGGRTKTVVNIRIGKLYDVAAPGTDAINATFTEKGRPVGDSRQLYSIVNNNKVGIVLNDNAPLAGATASGLKSGDRVLIISVMGDFYKVRKAENSSVKWTEGIMFKKDLRLQ